VTPWGGDPEAAFHAQLGDLTQLLRAAGVPVAWLDGVEADSVIGALCASHENSEAAARVSSAALGGLAERLSFIILAHPEVPCDIPAALTLMPCRDDCLAARLDAHLECRGASGEHDVLPEWLLALAEAARAAGSLAESDLARRLDCPEDEVGLRLTLATDMAGDVVYIDGFGLCTAALLGQDRDLIHEEMATNRGRLELARLGRRLRSLVGRNEGLHALLAYLIGELRPID
jgi:hypothetical protein